MKWKLQSNNNGWVPAKVQGTAIKSSVIQSTEHLYSVKGNHAVRTSAAGVSWRRSEKPLASAKKKKNQPDTLFSAICFSAGSATSRALSAEGTWPPRRRRGSRWRAETEAAAPVWRGATASRSARWGAPRQHPGQLGYCILFYASNCLVRTQSNTKGQDSKFSRFNIFSRCGCAKINVEKGFKRCEVQIRVFATNSIILRCMT